MEGREGGVISIIFLFAELFRRSMFYARGEDLNHVRNHLNPSLNPLKCHESSITMQKVFLSFVFVCVHS